MADTPSPLGLRLPDPGDGTVAATDVPLAVDAARLATMLCCGLRTVRTWDAAGKLPAPVRLGGRVLWVLEEVRAWLAAGAPDRKTWAAIRRIER